MRCAGAMGDMIPDIVLYTMHLDRLQGTSGRSFETSAKHPTLHTELLSNKCCEKKVSECTFR